jgi:hypothetical protein
MDNTRARLQFWKVLPLEDSVKQIRDEGYCSLGWMHKRPVRDTIRARKLAKVEPLHGLLDLRI